jgi:hypothetical protein
MTCKKIQRKIMDGWRPVGRDAVDTVSDHVANCTECRLFMEDYACLRSYLKPLPEVTVPPDLDRDVLALSHRELSRAIAVEKRAAVPQTGIPVPRLVAFGLVFIIAVTLWIILPAVGDLNLADALTPRERFILLLIGQNALMLLLSPVIFKKFGKKQHIFKAPLQNGSGDMMQQEV